jgi:thiol-disulfide isomerase/thioredoxin
MKKNLVIIIVVAVMLVGAGTAYALVKQKNTKKASQQTAMMHDQTMSDDKAMADGDMSHDAAVSDKGYITLSDYNANKAAYADNKKVLFFHASWCPICQSIDKAITADPSQIPTKTTIVKTDYDSNQDLRKKYGVTYQYTFVQIDNDGKQLKKWSATTLADALSQIQ